MSKISQGILDGFKGKVGTVVGYFWKGKPVMRGYKRFVKDSRTAEQLVIRERFAVVSVLSSAFKAASELGFKKRAQLHGNTEHNNFVQLNWEAVQRGGTSAVEVDYSNLLLSVGSLPSVVFGSTSYQTPQRVEATFAPNSESSGASENDRVYLFAYNPEVNSGALSEGALRSSQRVALTVPASWSGEKVHVWGFAVGGGETNPDVASYSSYLGEGTIG